MPRLPLSVAAASEGAKPAAIASMNLYIVGTDRITKRALYAGNPKVNDRSHGLAVYE